MNRYEHTLIALVAARIADGFEPAAADSLELRQLAADLESHFQARDLATMKQLDSVPALLKRQAE